MRWQPRPAGSRVVPLAWLAHVGMEVTSALQAAWESLNPLTGQPLRALHCDVKPSNVRISASGSVKLLDFGVAQSQSREEGLGVIAGTRAFLPPERWQGAVASPSSDLFALGVTLLALTGCADPRSRPTGAAESQAWVEQALATCPGTAGRFARCWGPCSTPTRLCGPITRNCSNRLTPSAHRWTAPPPPSRVSAEEVDGLLPLADAHPDLALGSALQQLSPQAVPLGLRAADADDDTAAWSALDVAAGCSRVLHPGDGGSASGGTPGAAQSLQRLLDTASCFGSKKTACRCFVRPSRLRRGPCSSPSLQQTGLRQQRHASTSMPWRTSSGCGRAGVGPPPAVLDAV